MRKHTYSYLYIAICVFSLYILSLSISSMYNKSKDGFIVGENIYIFYHVYCNKNTLDVVKDQTTKIIFSGLYDTVTHVYCFLTGEKNYIDIIAEYISILPSKFKVEAFGINDTTYERFTLTKIINYITDNDKFLYIHSKGVSGKHDNDLNKKNNIALWSNFMEYFLIKKHKDCIEALNTYDIVGSMYFYDVPPIMLPHYGGNFWWSTGKYYIKLVKTYPEIGEGYYDPESYIFKAKPKHYEIDNNILGEPNYDKMPYDKGIYPNTYI